MPATHYMPIFWSNELDGHEVARTLELRLPGLARRHRRAAAAGGLLAACAAAVAGLGYAAVHRLHPADWLSPEPSVAHRHSLQSALGAAEVPEDASSGSFCCWGVDDANDVCHTCWREAKMRQGDYCAQSRKHCEACNAHWCGVEGDGDGDGDDGAGGAAAAVDPGAPPADDDAAAAPTRHATVVLRKKAAVDDELEELQDSNGTQTSLTTTTTTTSTTSLHCETAPFGSECYKRVMWVMRNGILEHPEWYPNVSIFSSFEHIQYQLWEKDECHCSRPCEVPMDPSLAGEIPPVGPLASRDGESPEEDAEAMPPLVQVAGEVAKEVVDFVIAPLTCNPAVQIAIAVLAAAAELLHPDKESGTPHPWPQSADEQEKCFQWLLEKERVEPDMKGWERNWCWFGMKDIGCHNHFYDHLTWGDMRREALRAGAPSELNFHPLKHPEICDRTEFGGAWHSNEEERASAARWFASSVSVFALSLPSSTERRLRMTERLDSLGIPFEFVDGLDMRVPGALDAAKEEGLIPEGFNLTRAQEEAFSPKQGMGNMGSISGTIGCASGHFRAQMHAAKTNKKEITVILEDDVSVEADFIPKLWQLVTNELPCDWQAVSLYSRCPFGMCVSPHLTRVQPDVNEPAWRCRHGVNYGFQGMLYRTSEIIDLQKVWRPIVFDEARPHCLDVDVALASISDQVRFYAVPASQNPGFLREFAAGSARVDINWQVLTTSTVTTTPEANDVDERGDNSMLMKRKSL